LGERPRFDRDHRFLYVANTGDHRILRIPVRHDGSAGPIEIFADGATLNGHRHHRGALRRGRHPVRRAWKPLRLANQAEEIQVLSPHGRLIARSRVGTNVLDFPASLVFRGDDLYLTNMSAQDGGINSKLSVFERLIPGCRWSPEH